MKKKLFIAHSSSFDFNEFYKSLSKKLSSKYDLFLPHHNNREVKTIEAIKESDLFIAETSYPSTGMGIEIGWALSNNIPLLCIYKKGSVPSSALKFVCKDFIEYEDYDDLFQKIDNFINGKD